MCAKFQRKWTTWTTLPNYVGYFGSNDVEGVAESWAETEMSRVEVDGAGWRWVHGLVIPFPLYITKTSLFFFLFTQSCGRRLHLSICT